MKRFPILIVGLLSALVQTTYAQNNDTTSGQIKLDTLKRIPDAKPVFLTDTMLGPSRPAARSLSPLSLITNTDVGKTIIDLSVSATGAAVSTIPIKIPMGVNGFTPEISLEYNSQSGNGIAGYGWGISGVSTISRIPATKFHAGRIGGVNLDNKDYFALDGQRLLLKSGTYGEAGAEYQTENYSNLRIFSRGSIPVGTSTGPEYFEIWYPDGSKAFYGMSTSSRTVVEYGVSYRESNLGARIEYGYSSINNVMYLQYIRYGAVGSTPGMHTIEFTYGSLQRPEQSYVGGQNIYRNQILKKISVSTNSTYVRHYQLDNSSNSILGYQRLSKVIEINGDETSSLPPVTFNYPVQNDVFVNRSVSNLSVSGIASNNSEAIFGDFTGNGTMDFIVRPNTKDKFYTFFDVEPGSPYMQFGYELNTGYHKDVFPVKWLTHNSKLLSGDGITVVKELYNSYSFDVYSRGYSSPVNFQYNRLWENAPKSWGYYSECDNQFHEGAPLQQEFFSGDFNGDGLTDLISLNRPAYNLVIGERWVEPGGWDPPNPWDPQPPITETGGCVQDYGNFESSQTHLINLDRRITTDFVSSIGWLMRPYAYGDKIYTADFNGDGKTDIVHITNQSMYVYSLNEANNYMELLWQKDDTRISPASQIYLGDFNGDGKTDLMFSTGSAQLYTTFMSNGKTFVKHEQEYPFINSYQTYWNQTSYQDSSFTIATDINGDGKTDFVRVKTSSHNTLTNHDLTCYAYLNLGYSESSGIAFSVRTYNTINTHIKHYPIPVILNTDKANLSLEVGILTDNRLNLFQFNEGIQTAKQLEKISNNLENHTISYSKLLTNPGSYQDIPLYQPGYEQTYPYVDLENASGFSVVSAITMDYNTGNALKRIFGYEKAVASTEGLGFLGFGKVIKSNWHVDQSDPNRMFDISISDPMLRGAVTKSFQTRYPFVDPTIVAAPITSDGASITNQYISRTDIGYQTQLLANKVFVNVPNSSASKNLLTGVTNQTTNEYDSYYNATKVTSNVNNEATLVEEKTYENNTVGYYIGRLLNQKNTATVSGDVHSTETAFTYSGFLPTQIKKKGHGTAWITEDLAYDTFGNIISSSISNATGTRTTSTTYEPTGRFPLTKTGVDGLTSSYIYDPVKGNLLTSTNAYGQTTTFAHDSWGRAIQATDYLGKKSYTVYSEGGNGFSILQWDEQGRKKTDSFNHLGQATSGHEETVLGTEVGTATEYDIYRRPYRKSQPSSPGSHNQWDETEFDEYGRIKKITSYTGKITNYTYNNLSTTVNDGTKSITTTQNALGQTVSVVDPGGSVSYSYYAHGGLKSANYNGAVQTLEYDGWGRKTKLIDPSAGQYQYAYNGFDEIIQEITPKGVTNYTFDGSTGRLEGTTVTGDAGTNLGYTYSYNNTTKLLEGLTFTNADGNSTTYTYTYDANKHPASTIEDNLYARFTKNYTYDGFGRLATMELEAKDKGSNTTVSRSVGYTYQRGDVLELIDLTSGQILSKVNALKATGQLASSLHGNSLKTTYNYDAFNLPQSTFADRISGSPANLMTLGYSFDAQRGLLNSRSNSAISSSETFGYDNLDRLTSFNDNNGSNSQNYDDRGLITLNSQLGNYGYSGTGYQQIELTNPTPSAANWYQDRSSQQIVFNAFKKPVSINEEGKEKIDFLYNAAQQRSHMFYGSNDTDRLLRPFRRHYSEEGSMEITKDIVNNRTSFTFYLGGDAYDAPAIYREVHSSSGTDQNIYYLQRDYLGSILLITDVNGNPVEKRGFDAWGNLTVLTDGNNTPLNNFLITDRGYTGHEHLLGVGIINMNGRLYDPKLHRFLSPDNYIQDPFNTQNFNRYGYGLNNPLMYTDPSGEIIVPIIIGASLGILTNGINNAIHDRPFFKGAFLAGLSGGLSGGTASLIGDATSRISGTLGKVVSQSLAHGVLGGTISVINGGDFYSGFASGALGSVAAWGTGELLSGTSEFWQGAGMIVSGSLVGGVGAEISGGDFWDGFRNGAISSSLNHVAHLALDDKKPKQQVKKKEYASPQEYMNDMLLPFNELMLDIYQWKLALEGLTTVSWKSIRAFFAKKGPQTFKSFADFKKAFGPAGEGQAWHHIVEQGGKNASRFAPEALHNTNNVIKLPHGAGSIHAKVSGYYSSKDYFTGGLTVRQWIQTKSYTEQYNFGIKILKQFGWKP